MNREQRRAKAKSMQRAATHYRLALAGKAQRHAKSEPQASIRSRVARRNSAAEA
jgi:hypothetical protein